MSAKPPSSRLGRAADLGLFIAVILGTLLAFAKVAAADPPAEHVPAGQGMGASGTGFAAMNRPTNPTETSAMKELSCPCGCARQSIHDCDCGTAAKLRARVQTIVGKADISTPGGRTAAYDAVLADFVKEYGESVKLTPQSQASWILPTLAVMGGLGLIVGVGRRWVTKRPAQATVVSAGASGDDDKYSDKLDDELAGTD